MPQMLRALPWAIAILSIALASAANLVPHQAATTLITILPILMVVSLSGPRCVRTRQEA